MSIKKPNTFHELTINNVDYEDAPSIKFPFTMTQVQIINDSLEEFEYSYNGKDKDGLVKWDDESHRLSDVSIGRIWFKSATANLKIRVLAWARF